MNNVPRVLILALLVLLHSCFPSSSELKKRSLRSLLSSGTPTAVATPTASGEPFDTNLYWYGKTNSGLSLVVPKDTSTVVYLRGDVIHDYLELEAHFTQQFCLVLSFNLGSTTAIEQLRVRAVPIKMNFLQTKSEKLFKIDLGERAINQSLCQGALSGISSSDGTATQIAYRPADVCPSCQSSLSSTLVALYTLSNGALSSNTIVPSAQLNLTGLSLSITPDSEITEEDNRCTNEECMAKGYQCCLQGQCVNDGQERPNASSHSDYEQAKREQLLNPFNFVRWPEIFYVCSQGTMPTPTGTPDADPITEATNLNSFLKELYFCLNLSKVKTASYDYCPNLFSSTSYKSTQDAIWTLCECTTVGTPTPNSPATTCPSYGLNAYDSQERLQPTPSASSASFEYGKTYNLNANQTPNNVAIRGEKISDFIENNLDKEYCLVISFAQTAALEATNSQQLRLALSVKDYYDYYQQIQRLAFVPDLTGYQNNQLHCAGTINNQSTATGTVAFQLSDIVGLISGYCAFPCTSTSVHLYESSNGQIRDASQVAAATLNISGVLNVNIAQSGTSSVTTRSPSIFWFQENADDYHAIRCKIPAKPNPTPFQQLNLAIPSRSAPHRYYLGEYSDESSYPNGFVKNIIDLSGTPETTPTAYSYRQEGTPFYYDDENGKLSPQNTTYNMNAILGPFSLNRKNALPALTVEGVSVGETYIISTISGNYTPCPTCAKDSWYNLLTAFPTTSLGVGVESYSTSTARDAADSSSNYSNYEDLIFGRACWVPPTMLPFSHVEEASSIPLQRQKRLLTQASLFSNGYQRDWFGFNKGALIGSFDGYTWFAIGKNRRVQATSDKLFLAINAPFADLADPGEQAVQIIKSIEQSSAPIDDYDFSIADSTSPLQNQAGACQKWHLCERDSDCITALGWEYMCVNVRDQFSTKPIFNTNANEQLGEKYVSLKNYPFRAITSQNSGNLTINTTRRCIYRGAGAPCITNPDRITDNNNLRKSFTCAPNFYCAKLSSSSFSNSIARTPSALGNLLFGRDADVLGRPLKYLATSQLHSWAKAAIAHNISLQSNLEDYNLDDSDNDFGLCRPGPSVTYKSDNVNYGHDNRDSSGRADYISQIAPCNSSIRSGSNVATKRVHSCPILSDGTGTEDWGNYYFTANTDESFLTTSAADDAKAWRMQNSCGAECLTSSGSSLFTTIEKSPLGLISYINAKSLAQDGCLRRAGSVCHTDYDCSPNALHAQVAKNYPQSYFGDTLAEKDYWEQSLVCAPSSWAARQLFSPLNLAKNSSAFVHPMMLNRCCRASGNIITLYTQNDFDYPSVETSTDSDNANLNTANLSITDPQSTGRYSRYSIIDNLTAPDDVPWVTDANETTATIVSTQPKIEYNPDQSVTASEPPRPFQWKTIHDTAAKSCCNGWIRLFADKTHNWMVSGRLYLDYSNFACLNFRSVTPISIEELGNVYSSSSYRTTHSIEQSYLCRDPANFGCAHYLYGDLNESDDLREGLATSTTSFVFPQPLYGWKEPDNYDRLDSLSATEIDNDVSFDVTIHSMQRNTLTDLAPYFPLKDIGYTNLYQTPYDAGKDLTFVEGANDTSAIILSDEHHIILQLPSYMNLNITGVHFYGRTSTQQDASENETFSTLQRANVPYLYDTMDCSADDLWNNTAHLYNRFIDVTGDDAGWCVERSTGKLFIRRHDCSVTGAVKAGYCDGNQSDETAIAITFTPIGSMAHDYPGTNSTDTIWDTAAASWGAAAPTLRLKYPIGQTPGNDLYYLEKLARFELIGIPQIFYEPIYCNSDRRKLVPGLFDLSTTFTGYEDVSPDERIVFGRQAIAAPFDYHTLSSSDSSNQHRFVTLKDKLALNDIFSPDKFACCERLGSSTTDYQKCCSGFGYLDTTTQSYTCALPIKTDLNLYFNRFISGEGSYADLDDSMRLEDADFDPYTGYPRLTDAVRAKLLLLGSTYCKTETGSDLQVYTGAAFGNFGLRPSSPVYIAPEEGQSTKDPYGILYASDDMQSAPDATNHVGTRGATMFSSRRWNHHYYCGLVP